MRSPHLTPPTMVVDCDSCPVRARQCDECMVTALRGLPVVQLDERHLRLDAAERAAVDRFVAAGLVSVSEAAGLTARPELWQQQSAAG